MKLKKKLTTIFTLFVTLATAGCALVEQNALASLEIASRGM